MFKKFKELFSSESLLESAFDTTLTMLESCLEMYDASVDALRKTDSSDIKFDVNKMDVQINKYEREVRKNVLMHLTVSGVHNLVPSLVLVSIVIDVERIGDYTKNISDLAKLHSNRLSGGPFEDDVVMIEQAVSDIFPKVIEAIKEQDVDQAGSILRREQKTGKASDTIVDTIIIENGQGLSVSDAASLALYVRYLKRINAHLTNIASSIVNPFPMIGFKQKDEQ